MADAALRLLDSLGDREREAAAWPFPSTGEREAWFYTPTDHGGLALAAMTQAQQRLAHGLVASGLSRAGYVTAATIIGLENVLDHTEGWASGFGRERGRDPLAYWVAVFGSPAGEMWAWRFGGHHVSLHYTIVDGEVAGTTPCFLGADPASSPLLGPHLLRPLAGAEDLGRELVHGHRVERPARRPDRGQPAPAQRRRHGTGSPPHLARPPGGRPARGDGGRSAGGGRQDQLDRSRPRGARVLGVAQGHPGGPARCRPA
jgi:hypothetical protein